MDIVFLDASVLFSAAYRPKAKLLKLWRLPEVARLISSPYATAEAARNLSEPAQRERLDELLESVELVIDTLPYLPLPEGVKLPQKDVPILRAAIAAHASHLLTGDLKHFGHYFWQIIDGVMILPPAVYLKGKA